MKGKEKELQEEKMEEESNESKLVNANKHLENLNREKTNASKQVPEVQTRKDLLLEEIELKKANDKIVQDNFTLLEHKWEFEKVPEYIDNTRKLNLIDAKKKDINNVDMLEKLNKALEMLEAQIKGYDEVIEETNKKVEDLKKGE